MNFNSDRRFFMDQQIITMAQNGQADAFQTIVRSYLPRVVAIARKMVFEQALAEDIAQEVFVKLWKNIDKFDEQKASFNTWIYKITKNVAIDHLRKRKISDQPFDETFEIKDEKKSVEENLVIKELVEKAMADLPERQRYALILSQFEGLSQREIAAVMDVSEGAVESLLVRARRSLKLALKDLIDET